MALFIVAKELEGESQDYKDCIYRYNKDLRNLIFYCYNHCTSYVMNNLYPFGMACVYDQFLYLQKRRFKKMNTKALHFIISFDSMNYESDLDNNTLVSIMQMLNRFCFEEYQHILFLHTDKPSHHHIHYIVNPVNINNLHICRWSFWSVAYSLAEVLGDLYDMPLIPVTYQDERGSIVKGTETGSMAYQQKFIQRYNLKEG